MGQQTLTRRAIRCHTHKVFSRADLRLLDHFIYGRSEGSLTKLFALSMTSFCVPLRVLRILQIPCPAHSRGVSWPAYWGRLIGRGSPLNTNSFDNPKSANTQCPLALRSIFSGFRSRTIIPCLCLSGISHVRSGEGDDRRRGLTDPPSLLLYPRRRTGSSYDQGYRGSPSESPGLRQGRIS